MQPQWSSHAPGSPHEEAFRSEPTPARDCDGNKNSEDQRVNGTPAHADDMDRAQPKAGYQIEDAFSHSLGPRKRGGEARCFWYSRTR
jgi:hypothetical protein